MNRTAGFTLLEVLVAVTLLSIAIAAVYANFSIGLNSYKKGIDRGEIIQEARGGLRVLQSDLERMLPGAGGTEAFGKELLSFLVLAEHEKSRVQSVTYALAGSELTRNAVALGETSKESSSVPLIRGITSAQFEYHSGGEWVTEIKENPGKDSSPLAVRIKLGLAADGEEGIYRTAYLLPVPQKKEHEKKQGK